jgi:glycosyltransferase involved in cell wall biosynthesis
MKRRGPVLLFVVNEGEYFRAHWLDRAKAAQEAGYEVHVATDKGRGVREFASEGLTFQSVSIMRGRTTVRMELETVLALSRLYDTLRPDLVHHITIKPMVYGGLAARVKRVPAVVSTVPGLGYVFAGQGLFAGMRKAIIKSAYRLAFGHRNSRVIFENPDDCKDFEEWRLIRNGQGVVIKGAGVDLQSFKPRSEENGPARVLMAGRLLWEKGVGEFVEAARLVRQRRPGTRFILVGEGDPGSPATVPDTKLQEWHESGLIERWRWRNDMPAVLGSATVVCLPSFYREGVPRILIEAAACGRPIVTTDAPGCREIVRHGENGLLVPVRDTKALADAVERLIDDPDLRHRMGSRGREIAEAEFGKETVIEKTLAVYEDLISFTPRERRPLFQPTTAQ